MIIAQAAQQHSKPYSHPHFPAQPHPRPHTTAQARPTHTHTPKRPHPAETLSHPKPMGASFGNVISCALLKGIITITTSWQRLFVNLLSYFLWLATIMEVGEF